MTESRRTALVTDGSFYAGPALARELADLGHDLVIGEPQDGLVEELTACGSTVEAVRGPAGLDGQEKASRLVRAGLDRFGRIDAAVAATGAIATGRFLRSTIEDLREVVSGCLEAPYWILKEVLPVMLAQGEGQILLLTSAAGMRPTPAAPLYSSARAAANMLARNVAAEVAGSGIQVNVVGSNFMDFTEFLAANKATDPEGRHRVESMVPMGRLGQLEELAHFCMPFLDGKSRFTTGQVVAYAGGWA